MGDKLWKVMHKYPYSDSYQIMDEDGQQRPEMGSKMHFEYYVPLPEEIHNDQIIKDNERTVSIPMSVLHGTTPCVVFKNEKGKNDLMPVLLFNGRYESEWTMLRIDHIHSDDIVERVFAFG